MPMLILWISRKQSTNQSFRVQSILQSSDNPTSWLEKGVVVVWCLRRETVCKPKRHGIMKG